MEYIKKSILLEEIWQRPITGEQLQAEMNRMVKNTKDPETLKKLFEALRNDPFLIEECLARPVLVDRLIRNWDAFDERFHGQLKKEAENLRKEITIENFEYIEKDKFQRIIIKKENGLREKEEGVIYLKKEEFERALKEYPEENEISKVEETAEGFLIKISYKKDENEINGGIIFFQKNTFDEWFKKGSKLIDKNLYIEFKYEYKIPEFIEKNKTFMDSSDTWKNFGHFPKERRDHTAVWTGSEMIIWGGYNGSYLNTGGRYYPSADIWASTFTADAPSGRAYHTAVWTGNEMIVWGGYDGTNFLNTGGRYYPPADTWASTGISNVPSPRQYHKAIWTGSGMIVWGGYPYTNAGGIYYPYADAWASMNLSNSPDPREGHTAVWTGDEMIIWGGNYESYYYNTGGRYSPIADSWIPISTTGVPSARAWHTAVWTGESMIVWDGYPTTQSGGIYFPYCSPFQFNNIAPLSGSIDQPLNNLTIDWEDSKYAKSYDLYFGASSPPPLYQSNLSSSIYALNGLQSNTTYYWYVVAKNSCGERAGEVWSFTTCILPSNFNNLSPENNSINISAKNLLLDWEDSSLAEAYNLYFGYTNPPPLFKTGIMQSQFTIPALAKYGTYYWYVEAVNSCGNKISEIFSFKTYNPDNIDKGTVYDWGWNYFGQLGDGTNNDSNVPIQVLNLTNIIEIAGGKNHSLALKDDGTVWAWGLNLSGQLGNGTYSNSNIPVQAINLTNIIAIAGGGYHSLALKDNGTVWAWGMNDYGQLGNGTNDHSNIPVQVLNLTGAIGISGGGGHSIALKDNGTVWTWGRNNYGQLGNGTNVSSNTPVQVLNLINPVEIANGMDHSLSTECLIPDNFSNLIPENDSINQRTYGLLIDWEDSLNTKYYDLYLGIENPPSLYQSNIQESQYILNGLSYNTTYYWYIVAKNSCSVKVGATWQFTTAFQPKVIPDGSGNTLPMNVTKNNVNGTDLEINWDGQCNPQNANIIYGPLSEISNYTITGSKCDIQNPDIWNIGETSNIWFVILSDNGAGIESSWGLNSSGEHRNGTTASSQCGNNLKDNSDTCP